MLHFIDVANIQISHDNTKKQVREFIRTAADFLGFNDFDLSEIFDELESLMKQGTYDNDIYEKDENEDELEDESLINQI